MSIRCPRAALQALAVALLFPSAPALADDAETAAAPPQQAAREGRGATAREVYFPADFERFAPRSAADLVEEIPGFDIDDSGDGSRGFGQAQGNLLINGERISSKSTSTAEALARIPVGNVVRIEVDYRAEAFMGQEMVIRTRADSARTSSMVLLQDAVSADDGDTVFAQARVVAVWIGPQGRPIRIPDEVRTALGLS